MSSFRMYMLHQQGTAAAEITVLCTAPTVGATGKRGSHSLSFTAGASHLLMLHAWGSMLPARLVSGKFVSVASKVMLCRCSCRLLLASIVLPAGHDAILLSGWKLQDCDGHRALGFAKQYV
jgi:hypothetical protein